MPIRYVQGDLLSSPAAILVIPVNCVGVAGKGLALQCKQRYPEWFESYVHVCQTGQLAIGRPFLHLRRDRVGYILSFPTKDDWRSPSRLDSITAGFQYLMRSAGPWVLASKVMAWPKLGCGAGGLSWGEVQPLMEFYLQYFACTTLIYV